MVKKILMECDFCGKEIKDEEFKTLKSSVTQDEEHMCHVCIDKLENNKKQLFKDKGFLDY